MIEITLLNSEGKTLVMNDALCSEWVGGWLSWLTN